MKIKTAEATGRVLNYLVAVALGGEGLYFDTVATYWIEIDGKDRALSKGWSQSQSFTPASDPSHAWPIIDREGIELFRRPTTTGHEWVASKSRADKRKAPHKAFGPNSLIAAMRCWAMYKLGEEVEVPDELFEATGD